MELLRPGHSLSLAGHVALDITCLHLLYTLQSTATRSAHCRGLNLEISAMLPKVFGTYAHR